MSNQPSSSSRKRGSIPAFAGMTAILLFFTAPAYAVDVDPMRLELTIPADRPSRNVLIISNSGERTVNAHISPAPYRFLQTGATCPPSAESWFTFEPSKDVTLAPGDSKKITCIVTPPAIVRNDPHAEYVAALLVDELPAEEAQPAKNGAQITVVPRFALPVYLLIQDRKQVQAEITDLVLKPGATPGLLRTETTIENKGTIHLRPSGTITLFQQSGHTVLQSTPLGKAVPLFPSSTLHIPAVVPLPAPGRYKAVATIYLDPDRVIQKEKNFEVLPDGTVQ